MFANQEAELTKLTADIEQTSLAATGQRIEIVALNTLVESLKGQVSDLRNQIEAAHKIETDLNAEIAATKRNTEETWAQEQAENALLRERINDIAAEIARLTIALESPISPIETLLANAVDAPDGASGAHSGNGGGTADTAGKRTRNLGDRIRALLRKPHDFPRPTK